MPSLASWSPGARPGRTDGREIILFDSTGTALQDVAAAALHLRARLPARGGFASSSWARGMSARRHGIPLAEATRVWARIAALSFGGPAGQIAVMHRILVDEKTLDRRGAIPPRAQLLHAAARARGAAARHLYRLADASDQGRADRRHAVRAARLRRDHGPVLALRRCSATSAAVAALFFGLKAAVLAIVLQAVRRIGRRALEQRDVMRALAAAAFVGDLLPRRAVPG